MVLKFLYLADQDTGKAPLLEPIANTQSRVRFEKVNLLPKKGATGEKQNASSFLLASGRGSRGGRIGAMGGTRRRSSAAEAFDNGETMQKAPKRGGAHPRAGYTHQQGRSRGSIRGRGKESLSRADSDQAGDGVDSTPVAGGSMEQQSQLAHGTEMLVESGTSGRTRQGMGTDLPDFEEF